MDKTKPSKKSFSSALPKLLPATAMAGAVISVIFTFLIGVSITGSQNVEYDIYSYFDSELLKSFTSLLGVYRTAQRTVVLFGLIFSIIGILTVVAFAGLTVYSAIRKYVYKKNSGVEKYSICTFIAYAVFAGIFYSLHYANYTFGELSVHTAFNLPTMVGLAVSTLIMSLYFILKTLSQRQFLQNKLNKFGFLYTAALVAFIAILIVLLTAPTVFVKVIIEYTVGTENATFNGNFSMGFIQLINFGLVSTTEEKLSSLISSASCGFVILALVAVLYAVLAARLLFSIFGKKKNDNVFFIVGFAASLVLLFFGAVAGSFFTDLKDILTVKGVSEIIEESRNINVAIPLTVFVLSVAVFVAVMVYPVIIGKIVKKQEKKKEEQENVENENILLEVKNLCKHFVVGRDFFGRPIRTLKAVDNVTFRLEKGKTLGIVGESGCGKTTMGRTVLRLYDVTSGEVRFKGRKISSLSNREFDKLRPDMQMIFQDPYASLSPRLTVGEIIGEAVKQHKLVPKKEYHDYILSVMKMCGLQPHYFERYPHEFSGGQRQRICIARALALKPELVICDEPVSALDVSIQAQIINMLIELRKSLGLTYVFISHDLSVVKHISDEVGVMYLGSLVEYGSKDSIFENTLHPYTRALFSAVPVPDPHVKMNRIILKGDIPSPVNPPSGCKFHTRCESCMDICGKVTPIYKEVEPGHFCACHLYNTEEETKQLELIYENEQKLAEHTAVVQTEKKSKKKHRNDKQTEVNDVPQE